MNLIKRNNSNNWFPFHDIETLQDEMNRLFDFSIPRGPDRFSGFGGWSPALDIKDEKDQIVVKTDLPGLTKDQIKVSVENGILTISGERKTEQEDKQHGYVRSERTYGKFYRAIQLSSEVDAQKVKAVYKDGVLELALPKREDAKPKIIDIEVK